MSTKDIEKRWIKDKDFFSNKEIGELQDFVKDVLNDPEIFGLKKGLGSKKNKNRKYEFTIETSKKGRRADFVIFINGEDVVIPVEVERHNNIKKGIEQIFQYQKDWEKKYAILTDGKEWRFYRSNKFKTFYIQNILANPKDLIVYWKEYIKPENYYIELFNNENEEKIEKLDLNNQENRILFFDDITQVIDNFKGKMRAIGAFDDLFNYKENDKISVETSYAYLIQFILYKVLIDNEYKKFKHKYNHTLIKISKAIQDKDFYSIIITEIKNISEYISHHIYKPFAEEQKSINKKLISNLRSNLSIDDIAPWLDIILFINRYNFAGLKNEVFGYIYENYLKDLYQDKNKGQYFTDPAIVNFMLKEIGYTKNEIEKRDGIDKISIIDPSCGAGTFLYSATDRIIETFDNGTESQSKHIEKLIDKNIFGFDIEEFPLYLAEMNILMRLLPLIVNDSYENPIDNKLKIFKTKDSIGEFLETGINSKIEEEIDLFEHLKTTALDYPSFMRDEKDLEEMLNSLKENSGVRERFDFVIGNPPYIGYNECSKQKMEFVKKIQNKNDNSITMGRVYGMNLNTVPGRHKKNTPKPNLYAFFISLGLGLLKDKGRLCYIIPQNVLTSRDLDVIRYHLSKFTTIDKLVTFEGNMFIGRGLKQNKPVATSSLIFVVRKQKPKKDHRVTIMNFKPYKEKQGINFEKYLKSSHIETREILQTKLYEDLVNWNFIKKSDIYMELCNSYRNNSYSIEEYRNYGLSDYDDVCFDIGYNIDEKKLLNCKDFYVFPKIEKEFLTIRSARGYLPKDTEIKLLRANQGYKLLNTKFKILWSYHNLDKFYFSDKNLISARNKFCFIGSNLKTELLYLYSLLNSKLNIFLLNSFLKISNEKALLIGLSSIKQYIYIPRITNKTKHVKAEIIKQSDYLLSLEEYQLKDFVDFTTTRQQFNTLRISDDNLVLIDNQGEQTVQKIKSKSDLLKAIIEDKFNDKSKTGFSLHDLKYYPIIDKKLQYDLKDYIDDLIFSLYFNIKLSNVCFNNAKEIKKQVSRNEFYSYLHVI